MMITLTPRQHALLQLLEIEPAPCCELIAATGWGIEATRAALDDLVRIGHATYRNSPAHRVYMPADRARRAIA